MSLILILTGKTASGKDTIISNILQKYPAFKKVLTTTSRTPRQGEKNGVDYLFLSEDEFRKKVQNKEFLEYVEYGGNLYGTEKSQFLSNTQNLIWKIDPSRAGSVRELLGDAKLLVIYINTDDETILQRLRMRGLSSVEIEKRMQDDKSIWEQYRNNYDYVLENTPGKLDKTMDKIITILDTQGLAPSGLSD